MHHMHPSAGEANWPFLPPGPTNTLVQRTSPVRTATFVTKMFIGWGEVKEEEEVHSRPCQHGTPENFVNVGVDGAGDGDAEQVGTKREGHRHRIHRDVQHIRTEGLSVQKSPTGCGGGVASNPTCRPLSSVIAAAM